MTDLMPVQLVGGPYDGHTVHVTAVELYETGELRPEPSVWHCPDPHLPESLLAIGGAENVLGEAPYRLLTYDRQHRGDRWVYVLHGLDESGLPEKTDPLLAAFIQHIRDQWPNRQYFTAHEAVMFEQRVNYGQDFEDHLRTGLMRSLHDSAAKQDLMILAVDGPTWKRRHVDYRDEVFEVTAVGLPRFHPRKETKS